LVRFVSCVALHAIWSTSVALFLYTHQWVLQGELAWHDFIPRVVFVVLVPMFLHGLYDTLLKKEFPALALVVALVSFGWLVWCTVQARSMEEEPAVKARPRYA